MERQKGTSGRGGEGEERVQGSASVGELKWKLDTSINDPARAPTARVGDGTSITGGTRASSR